jgi:hypothetical protein
MEKRETAAAETPHFLLKFFLTGHDLSRIINKVHFGGERVRRFFP